MRPKKQKKPELKIAIGEPQSCPQGFTNVVSVSATWPQKNNSVTEVFSHYYLQRVPGKQRGQFMEELHRVLVPGGKATIIVPYYTSMRAVMDYRYEWPPLAEMSFLYFNKGWRDSQKVSEPNCDFDFGYGYFDPPETSTRSPEVASERRKSYWNAVNDLQVNLVKR